METIKFENGYGRTYTFEVVDKIPDGYSVWNIDFNKLGGDLVPLCKCYEGTYDVITDELKAIRISDENERTALKVACAWGFAKDELKCTLKQWGDTEEHIAEVLNMIDVANGVLKKYS